MPVLERESGILSTPTQSAEISVLQPRESDVFNRHKLVEYAGNIRTDCELQKANWDSLAEIIRFIGDINLGLIKGLTLKQAVAFSTQILTDHIRFYDAEFIKQEPVLPHHNYFGSWQGEKRLLGNNGRPVAHSVDATERLGAAKRAAEITEEFLLNADNNSFVVSVSAQGVSGYMDENGDDNRHLNTYILVDWKDGEGNLKGLTLVTDLTIDQAERVMGSLGVPSNLLARRGSEMHRVATLLENPALLSLPTSYHDPVQLVLDRVVAERGEKDIHLRQRSGSDEVRSMAEMRQKIAQAETVLDLNITKENWLQELTDFILADYHQVGNWAFQQEIINLAEKAVKMFADNFLKFHKSQMLADYSGVLPLSIPSEWETAKLRDYQGDFREAIAFLQSRAGCPSSVKGASGRSGVAGVSIFGESDSMGSLYFSCPICGAVNKRPWEGYVNNCQSCGSDKVSCGSSTAKTDDKKEDSKIIAFPTQPSAESAKAA